MHTCQRELSQRQDDETRLTTNDVEQKCSMAQRCARLTDFQMKGDRLQFLHHPVTSPGRLYRLLYDWGIVWHSLSPHNGCVRVITTKYELTRKIILSFFLSHTHESIEGVHGDTLLQSTWPTEILFYGDSDEGKECPELVQTRTWQTLHSEHDRETWEDRLTRKTNKLQPNHKQQTVGPNDSFADGLPATFSACVRAKKSICQ